MDIEIINGGAADVERLGPLWAQLLEHHRAVVAGDWPVRAGADSWERCRAQYLDLLAKDEGLLLVARRPGDDAPLGFAFVVLHGPGATFDLGERRGEVDTLVVAAGARGGGTGAALLEACRAALRERGIAYLSIGVLAANPDAARLYERVGFRPWTRELLTRTD
ncbi:GNAT family N-acetyltransferase [Actinomadura parmotrematis]|uniref:GNAT family N-acetyltransferase n=1 Tax=Actinomadura parmotrematis TaxID=2864039 RepID=A0ABS7FZI1_9ACTN|nr:GNAT family N-acetyltransferase [Actinomadura parmotrematis]MBW8485355.1 GNAT family N-acetyltransferase [Actinomadura parmotrematis]